MGEKVRILGIAPIRDCNINETVRRPKMISSWTHALGNVETGLSWQRNITEL